MPQSLECSCEACRVARSAEPPRPHRRVRCDYCTALVDSVEEIDGTRYCARCIGECTCGCGHRGGIASFYDVSGQLRCRQSMWECRFCYGRFLRERNARPPEACGQCATRYRQCETCENFYDLLRTNGPLCLECVEERDRLIHGHSYRPSVEFFALPTEKNPAMYMGVELEIDRAGSRPRESHNEVITRLIKPRPEFYCKHDGSIEDGFEIVSHPCTYAWWMNESLSHFPQLAAIGYKSYNTTTCGMHVHVTRSYFSKGEVFKLLEFIDTNQRFVLKMSRRDPAQLRQWARPEGTTMENYYRMRDGNDHDDRYRAVNLENEHTIEFRIFRGTLNIDSFKLNLAFVRTLCGYIKDCSMRETYPSHYCDWLKKHRGVVGNGKLATKLIEWVMGACVPDEVVEV